MSIALLKGADQIGLWLNASGTVTIGQKIDVGTASRVKFIRVLSEGNILVEGLDGVNYFLPSVPAGEFIPWQNVKKVLASGTDWQGQSRTTTASNIWWYGE